MENLYKSIKNKNNPIEYRAKNKQVLPRQETINMKISATIEEL